jgi:hypothetical protein
MADTGIFISSCSRRELARRRPGRIPGVRLQLLLTPILLAAGSGAFVVARGWI